MNITNQHQDEILEFKKFHLEVENELSCWMNLTGSVDQRNKLLNGGANIAATLLIKEQTRKEFGIFFTGHQIATLAASKIKNALTAGASVIDPACGAGDLLIACARHYPRQKDYQSTLSFWESRLAGIDLYQTFINTIKSRLKLLITEFHLPENLSPNPKKSSFPNFIVANALEVTDLISQYDLVVTNPPFGLTQAPPSLSWSNGKVQLAALFIDQILSSCRPNQEIVAILPDVLRSGSRYEKWRDSIASRAEILAVDIIGKFDTATDVDVFLLHLKSNQHSRNEWPDIPQQSSIEQSIKLESLFNVRVGPVVPHRDIEDGSPKLYVDSAHTSKDAEIKPTQHRRFNSTTYKGPFVVIRRTSSPNDKPRIHASIINTKDSVLVENHLIIVQPIDGRLETCRQLLEKLKNTDLVDWINQRIRCRHLTVAVIKEISLKWDVI